jgi:hypothetical protein
MAIRIATVAGLIALPLTAGAVFLWAERGTQIVLDLALAAVALCL